MICVRKSIYFVKLIGKKSKLLFNINEFIFFEFQRWKNLAEQSRVREIYMKTFLINRYLRINVLIIRIWIRPFLHAQHQSFHSNIFNSRVVMLRTKGLISMRAAAFLHRVVLFTQTTNNYRSAFESCVKKTRDSRGPYVDISRKKGKGMKINERESKDNACASFDRRGIFRIGLSSVNHEHAYSRGIAPIDARLPKRV